MEPNIAGKTFVVTGATSGIGQAAAEHLAGSGAWVIGVGRSAERCREIEDRLLAVNPDSPAVYCVADLSIQKDVRKLAVEIESLLSARGVGALDGLLNNAGTFTYRMSLTPEGFETQWAVNHLSAFLLTHQVLPLLNRAPSARVVTVSSSSHRAGYIHWNDVQLRRRYNGLRAYEQSKLANVLFTLELSRRLGPDSTVKAFAANPGLVKTNIGKKSSPGLVGWLWKQWSARGITPEESARGLVYLLADPSIQSSTILYWKHGAPQATSKAAQDAEAARRLWALSEQMCSLSETRSET